MKISQLKLLNEEQLFNYFINNAKYHPTTKLINAKYSIRLGSKIILAGDTAILRDKFQSAIISG